MAIESHVNVDVDEATRKSIEAQEQSWSAPKLIGLGTVSLAIAVAILLVMSQCQLAPVPLP